MTICVSVKSNFVTHNPKNMHSDVGFGVTFRSSISHLPLKSLLLQVFLVKYWKEIDIKKKWTRFSLKNHGRWQPGSPRYLRTNRGTYRQFDRIKNWWKFMVKNFVIWSRLWAWTFTKLIFFLFDNIFRASVLSEVQTSRNSQLPTSKNLLVLGKLFS